MRWSRLGLVCVVLLVVALISSAAVAPVLAQADDDGDGGDTDDLPVDVPDEYTAGDDGDEDENGDSDGGADAEDEATGGNDDDDAAGGTEQVGVGDGVGATVGQTSGELYDAGAEWFSEAGANFVQSVFEGTIDIVIGTPVPENAGWLGIFGEPTNEPFATLFADLHETWLFPLSLSFFALALLLNASVLPFAGFLGKYSASKWMVVAFGTIVAISLSWPVVTLLHLAADTIALSIAPSGEEITSSQGIETLVASAGPAAAAFYLTMGVKMILYGLIFGMRYFLLLMVLPYTFGLTLAVALFAPWRRLRGFASGALWIHVSLLLIPIPMAILFRAAYLLEWGFGFDGLVNLLLIMGLLVATVVIPIWMMFKATTMTGVMAGALTGAGTSLAARESYKPKTFGYLKRAPGKAREIGQSARRTPSRITDRASALRNGDLGALRRNSTRSSSSSSSSSGGTQAERKRIATDGGEKRRIGHFRRRNREGGEE